MSDDVRSAAPVEEEDSWIGLIGMAAVFVSNVGADIAGDMLAVSRTTAYALTVLVTAAVWSAFEVKSRSSSGRAEEGGDAKSRRRQWLTAVVRGTAIAASLAVLSDALLHRGGITAVGRLLAPASASLDYATTCGRVFLVSVGLSIAARRALLRRLRQ